ncbi:uncharacterized protein ACRADG_007297 [Cochliomyia hominivorax]
MNIKTEYEAEVGPTEMVFETVDLTPKTAKTISLWSNAETKQLMDLHRNLINEVGNQKRFKRKKDMWMEISLHFPNRTPKQCEERFKTVLKRKKNNFGKVYISEAKRKTIEILDNKPEFENKFQIIRRPKVENNREEFLINNKNISAWTLSETKQLIELYKRLIGEVGPQRRFSLKKDMWTEISLHFTDKNPKQCEQRLNSVFKRKQQICLTKETKKSVVVQPKNPCNTFQINKVQILKNNINSDDNEAEETFKALINKSSKLEKDTDPIAPEIETNKIKANKEMSLNEVLLHIAAKREEGKERRHKEKLQAISKMQDILQQLLDLKKNKKN